MKLTGQRERGTAKEHVARRTREGDGTSRMELERSGNECPVPNAQFPMSNAQCPMPNAGGEVFGGPRSDMEQKRLVSER